MNKLKLIAIVFFVFIIGIYIGASKNNTSLITFANNNKISEQKKETIWTCSMHPQIKLPKPGKCPICAMDLFPLDKGPADEGEKQFSMSHSDIKLAEIQTTTVKRKLVETEVKIFGKLTYDETRVKAITAWVPGRLDRLFVDYTGIQVKKDDHLAMIYSPELLTAQKELIEAFKRVKETHKNETDFLKESNLRSLKSAREKLKLWGIKKNQILDIESKEKSQDLILLTAPIGGIVIQKDVFEGMYVKTGKKLFTIADLNHLWLKLDAYESDLQWIRYGQSVKFSVEAYPGETFKGWISFIDPALNNKTRTIKVRVNVDNREGKLKPGMFVSAMVRSKISMSGKVMEPDLLGKWICPMHPEIKKNEKSICDICKMDLVKTESLGYKTPDFKKEKPIVVPTSAVLRTGKRAIVYIQLKDKKRPTFEGREIVLGPKADKFYIVLSGLKVGEKVVTNGTFKIDSALQIQAKPSMMSIDGETSSEMKIFLNSLKPIYKAYFEIQESLASDSFDSITTSFEQLQTNIGKVDMSLVKNADHISFMKISKKISEVVSDKNNTQNIQTARKSFLKLSNAILKLEQTFGHLGEKKHFQMFCPMANKDQGASWLQNDEELKNPYFSLYMRSCGVTQKSFNGKLEE